MNHRSAGLEIAGLTKRYGSVVALDDLDLRVAPGDLTALLGPSGCGKTTTLQIVAGLLRADSGRIRIDDRDLTDVPPHRRNFGLVFQSFALFPHMTVAANIAYGPRRRGMAKADIARTVARHLDLVRLPGFADRYPEELSGGQQQRVALARALATEPSLLLLDEPLGNLDALLRHQMRVELRRLQKELAITTILVTHDQAEALTMADQICILRDGRVQQIGSADEVYGNPRNAFVAQFIGRSNVIDATVIAVDATTTVVRVRDGFDLVSARRTDAVPGDAVKVVLREDVVQCRSDAPSDVNHWRGRVVHAVMAGSIAQFAIQFGAAGADPLELLGEAPRGAGVTGLARGQEAVVHIDPRDVILTRD